jgi:hypothetical protein
LGPQTNRIGAFMLLALFCAFLLGMTAGAMA